MFGYLSSLPSYSLQCKIGDKLRIRVGGDFFYAPPMLNGVDNLLLLAGGVGINPLLSMLQHHVWLLSKMDDHHDNRTHPTGAVQLLYSAKNENELIFKVWLCWWNGHVLCHTPSYSTTIEWTPHTPSYSTTTEWTPHTLSITTERSLHYQAPHISREARYTSCMANTE